MVRLQCATTEMKSKQTACHTRLKSIAGKPIRRIAIKLMLSHVAHLTSKHVIGKVYFQYRKIIVVVHKRKKWQTAIPGTNAYDFLNTRNYYIANTIYGGTIWYALHQQLVADTNTRTHSLTNTQMTWSTLRTCQLNKFYCMRHARRYYRFGEVSNHPNVTSRRASSSS